MLDPAIPSCCADDRRYPLEAYVFVFEALNYAQNVLGLGVECASEPLDPSPGGEEEEEPASLPAAGGRRHVDGEKIGQRHVTGQELCEAIRRFALEQYGYMAKTVLEQLGHPLHRRLRRDGLQLDPHRADAKDGPTTAARISTTSTTSTPPSAGLPFVPPESATTETRRDLRVAFDWAGHRGASPHELAFSLASGASAGVLPDRARSQTPTRCQAGGGHDRARRRCRKPAGFCRPAVGKRGCWPRPPHAELAWRWRCWPAMALAGR